MSLGYKEIQTFTYSASEACMKSMHPVLKVLLLGLCEGDSRHQGFSSTEFWQEILCLKKVVWNQYNVTSDSFQLLIG
jgi:hypothetical protein